MRSLTDFKNQTCTTQDDLQEPVDTASQQHSPGELAGVAMRALKFRALAANISSLVLLMTLGRWRRAAGARNPGKKGEEGGGSVFPVQICLYNSLDTPITPVISWILGRASLPLTRTSDRVVKQKKAHSSRCLAMHWHAADPWSAPLWVEKSEISARLFPGSPHAPPPLLTMNITSTLLLDEIISTRGMTAPHCPWVHQMAHVAGAIFCEDRSTNATSTQLFSLRRCTGPGRQFFGRSPEPESTDTSVKRMF